MKKEDNKIIYMNINEQIELISNTFTKDNVILKAIEECTELNEVLIKTITKNIDSKPSIDKIIEETGDVLVRLMVLIEKLDIREVVDKRITKKLLEIEKYINK